MLPNPALGFSQLYPLFFFSMADVAKFNATLTTSRDGIVNSAAGCHGDSIFCHELTGWARDPINSGNVV